MAITSKEINLQQLDKELGGQGLLGDFNNPKEKLILPSENSNVTDEQLEAAIVAHIAVDDNAVREADKAALLAKLGITADEAKLLLS